MTEVANLDNSFKRHIVVVENETLLRGLIAQLLENEGFEVTTAANAADARRACRAIDPDAVVLDVELGPGPNGFDLAESLSRATPDIGIVFLTNLPDARFGGRDVKSLPRGSAYLRKEQLVDSAELVKALEEVLNNSSRTRTRHDLEASRPFAEMSRTQISVLRLIALGFSNQQIADQRGTTVRAVESLVGRIFSGVGVDQEFDGNARVEAARRYMLEAGIPENDLA